MPTVRAIVRRAAKDDYRFEAIVLGIVSSDAFREREAARIGPGRRPLWSRSELRRVEKVQLCS